VHWQRIVADQGKLLCGEGHKPSWILYKAWGQPNQPIIIAIMFVFDKLRPKAPDTSGTSETYPDKESTSSTDPGDIFSKYQGECDGSHQLECVQIPAYRQLGTTF
jgi:hypothetical protein